MSRYGSCNAFEFVSHSSDFSRLGNTLTRENVVDVGYGGDSASEQLSPKQASQRLSDVAIWRYDLSEIYPTVYVITTDDAAPTYVWEAESRPELGNDTINPMVSVDARGDDLVSGGSQAEIILPGQSALETFESTVTAASTPAWVTGTRYEDLSTTNMLQALFRSLTRGAGLRPYDTISDALNRFHDFRIADLYKLCWLRASSMILQDHQGVSAIPLMLNRSTIDTSDSPATVTLA